MNVKATPRAWFATLGELSVMAATLLPPFRPLVRSWLRQREAKLRIADTPSPWSITQLAMFYEKARDRTAAERLYLEALAVDPTNAAALVNLGLMYESDGAMEEAIRRYSRVITLATVNEELRAALTERIARLQRA